jgi:hypothetical protein
MYTENPFGILSVQIGTSTPEAWDAPASIVALINSLREVGSYQRCR